MDGGSLALLLLVAAASFALSFYGASIGLVLGHLRLPLIIYFHGVPAVGAATNLAISAAGALAGSARHARDGRVSWKLLLVMGLPSAVGAFFASRLAVQLEPIWSNSVIGLVLLLSGASLAATRTASETAPLSLPPWGRWGLEIAIGVGLGALAGVVGLMLGSMRLPAMMKILKVDPRVAVGTNMAIGCLTGLLGAAGALTCGGVDASVIAVVAPPTILGALLGARMTGLYRKEFLSRLVGWSVSGIGLFMVVQAVWGFASKA